MIIACSGIMAVFICAAAGVIIWEVLSRRPVAADTVKEYFALLDKGDYAGMYELLSGGSKKEISEEDFIERNQNIYEGIEAADIKVTIPEEENVTREDTETVTYGTSMETAGGNMEFDNQMTLVKSDSGEYRVEWDSTLIFPSLLEGSRGGYPEDRGYTGAYSRGDQRGAQRVLGAG